MATYNLEEKGGFFREVLSLKPNKILKKGEKLEFKHFSLVDMLICEVVDVNKDNVVLISSQTGTDTNFFPEEPIVLNYYAKELYVISCEINKIESMIPLKVTLKINNIEKMKDLRKNKRYYVSLPVRINSKESSYELFGIVKNISVGGVKINSMADFDPSKELDLCITINGNKKIQFKGKILRKNKLSYFFEYGIEISSITDSNQETLYSYIYSFE